jgi:hypothetical protein
MSTSPPKVLLIALSLTVLGATSEVRAAGPGSGEILLASAVVPGQDGTPQQFGVRIAASNIPALPNADASAFRAWMGRRLAPVLEIPSLEIDPGTWPLVEFGRGSKRMELHLDEILHEDN